jgi:hypothetical protein
VGRGLGERAELQPRAGVEQQHAAIEVAHHHALRQLGHQCREAVALLRDAVGGFGDAAVDRAEQLFPLGQQRVHGLGQRACAAGLAPGVEPAAGRRQAQHLHRLGQPAGRRAMAQPQAPRRRAGRERGHQPQQEDERQARLQQGPGGAPLGRCQRGAQQQGRAQQHGRQQRAGGQRRGDAGAVERRCHDASSSRTRAASSWVEKGLVM